MRIHEMHLRALALGLLLVLAAGPLRATEIYLGAGITGDVDGGAFRQDLERFTETAGDRWKLFAGVELGRHLAIELTRHRFGDQTCCQGIADLGFSSTLEGTSAAALFHLPVGRLSPFAKAGALAWSEDGETITLAGTETRSESGTEPMVGLGLDLDLGARARIRGEWEVYRFESHSSEAGSVSLIVRF